MIVRRLLLLVLAAAGCAPAAGQGSTAAAPSQATSRDSALLAPARIAALPAAQRTAWERYLERSRQLRAEDRRILAEEVKAAGLERATTAPPHSGFFLEDLDLTDAFLASDSARALADAIVSYQTPAGGWSKRLAFTHVRRPGESWASEGNQGWIGTLDNGGTTEQLRFLAAITRVRPDPRYHASFVKGIEYLLAAQFPNGCWPQVYPLVGSYHDAATFNDDATVNAIRVLHDVLRGELAAVPGRVASRALVAVGQGVRCIVRAQVVVDGRPTIWGQQHDPLTLAPIRARAYEHRSLASKESAAITELLMALDPQHPGSRRAVRGAAAWFRENARWGFEYEAKQGRVAEPGAGPYWPRFAEIGTNRAIFSNRDGVVLYEFDRLDEERRTGYGWYTEEPNGTLRLYRTWSRERDTTALAPALPAGRYSAIVDARHAGADGALVDALPTYRTIGAALAAAPAGNDAYALFIRDGSYREKLHVERPNVHFIGESLAGTVITYDAAAGRPSPGGWPWGTRGTATLRIAAPGFRLENLTVENAFDYLANAALERTDSARLENPQALAVMLDEGSDRAVFRSCRIRGHQDTLFPDAGRSWFFRCIIEGSVDFIFGAGRAVFEESDIVSRDRGSRSNNGYIAAPSTPRSQPHGFVFLRSRLRKETPGMAAGSVTLGRPWHPAGDPNASGSAVFIDSWMDDHVSAAGWTAMYSTDAMGVRVLHEPADARFFEHGSTGPGAIASPTRPQLPAEQLPRFDLRAVFGGWDPRQ